MRDVLADGSLEAIVAYELVTGDEPIGLSCRVFRTEDGPQGSPTEAQLRKVLGGL